MKVSAILLSVALGAMFHSPLAYADVYETFLRDGIPDFRGGQRVSLKTPYLTINRRIYQNSDRGVVFVISILGSGKEEGTRTFPLLQSTHAEVLDNSRRLSSQFTFFEVNGVDFYSQLNSRDKYEANAILPNGRIFQITHKLGELTEEEFHNFIRQFDYTIFRRE